MSLDRRSRVAASPGGDLARHAVGDAFLSRRATGGLLQDGAAPQRRAVWFPAVMVA